MGKSHFRGNRFGPGEIHFRFIGPAAYGDRVTTTVMLAELGERTLKWNCRAKNASTGALVTEGRATRVFARINEDGTLTSARIPDDIRRALTDMDSLSHLAEAPLDTEYPKQE